jgi:hypothetical protein
MFIKAVVVYTGLIIYAKYYECDPVLAGVSLSTFS